MLVNVHFLLRLSLPPLPYLVEIAYTIRDKKRGKGEGICLAECK